MQKVNFILKEEEIEITAIRAQGAGGQNVNKVSSAIHLRFDIRSSTLPDFIKSRLLALRDHRVTKNGEVIIKAQRFRTQEKNREDALRRLEELVASVSLVQKKRVATKVSKTTKRKRLDQKIRRGKVKEQRRKVNIGSE